MKKLFTIIILLAVVGGVGFYGGMKYAGNKGPGNQGNFSAADRQELRQRMVAGGDLGISGGQFARPQAGGFSSGEIIAKDEKSITIKLQEGGSKIIFFSDATNFTRMTKSTIDEFAVGEQITVNGSENDDGSITAQSIQTRPAMLPIIPEKEE